MDIFKFAVPELIFGRGSLKYTGICAKRLGAAKIFVVSDPGVEAAGWTQQLFELLGEEHLDYVYFNDVVANPRDYQVQRGAELYRREGADVVLALGGGSPMDAAKGIALVVSNGGKIRDYEGANQVKRPLPPMVFVPTTMGSESNISQFTVISDVERRLKMTLISRTLVPNISITDPLLLTTMTRDLVIPPLFDSLAHAVESYVSPIASPFTEVMSLRGLDLLIRHIRNAINTLHIDDLEQLAVAGSWSGMAFTNASVGLGHALAHALGGMYDIVHGMAHALLLPHVMRYNLGVSLKKMAKIGTILTGRTLADDEETALFGIEMVEQLREEFGLPSRLREILPDKTKLPQVSRNAVNDICLLTNPRPATWKDILNIYYEAW
ncbi:iron-containing alcohol dehydrogenase [Desulfovibrio sulfodismutans]|uniref:Iron-containing alcohol dehydrogenase n=1 Tax=Desulfolutivibrio sulfodismutans TaxID=63561 RepID=A0A7K3NGV4_9BACT|nr:iron-containing alcohol dehydrogenase [Desulfolutivibrio sulfodismutans]NDY55434.1 iron-containing alcohol dehydrogenase [Desulfolutivibrio sulfodismutans]QLA12194.1 iron-containing alcohol dehydrogenase [Desulfolutivibrio sulfodismutans DSM 3696]